MSDAGGRVQTDAKVVYEWQYDTVSPDGLSGANGSGKTVNQEISISDGNRHSDAMHSLSGPLEGVGAGTQPTAHLTKPRPHTLETNNSNFVPNSIAPVPFFFRSLCSR